MANKTKKQLEAEVESLQAALAHTYYFASHELNKLNQRNFVGSSVILEIKALNGKTLMQPVAIKDGLSDATMRAIKDDLVRSYKSAIAFDPENVALDLK